MSAPDNSSVDTSKKCDAVLQSLKTLLAAQKDAQPGLVAAQEALLDEARALLATSIDKQKKERVQMIKKHADEMEKVRSAMPKVEDHKIKHICTSDKHQQPLSLQTEPFWDNF